MDLQGNRRTYCICIESEKVKKGRETFSYAKLGKVLLAVLEILKPPKKYTNFFIECSLLLYVLFMPLIKKRRKGYSVICDDYPDDQQEIGFDAVQRGMHYF